MTLFVIRRRRVSCRGFTLMELLTVIAIIAILGAILFPALNSARRSSLRAKSKAQFGQYIVAIEGFRQEYGFYPFLSGTSDTAFWINDRGNRDLFERVLTGDDRGYNRRGIRFYSFTNDELVDPTVDGSLIRDAFGNTSLILLIDGNLDGRIDVAGYDLRGSVAVVAEADEALGYPRVTTWNEVQ